MARSKTSQKQAATTAEKKTRERERERERERTQERTREKKRNEQNRQTRREEWRGSGELRKKMKIGWGIQGEDWIITSTAATYIFTVPTCYNYFAQSLCIKRTISAFHTQVF